MTDALPAFDVIEATLRIELAAAELRVDPAVGPIIGRWIRRMPSDPGGHVGVATSVGLGRTTWRAAGDPGAFIEPMADFFDEVGADPERLDGLTRFGRDVQPARIGSWLQTREEHLDAGWYAPVALDIADLWEHTPESKSRQGLADWFEDQDIDTVAGFERSLGPADYAGFWIPLPGAGATSQLAAAEDLMDDLDLGTLPQVIRDVLLAQESATLIASVWLIAEGVARLAIGVLEPENSVLIALSMAVGANQDDLLARVQGALDAEAPAYVEAVLYGGTVDVEVAWDLPKG